MTDEQIAERLADRAKCEAEHAALRVPHNGFGWTGSCCSQCGFSFFGQWEPWVSEWLDDGQSTPPPDDGPTTRLPND